MRAASWQSESRRDFSRGRSLCLCVLLLPPPPPSVVFILQIFVVGKVL